MSGESNLESQDDFYITKRSEKRRGKRKKKVKITRYIIKILRSYREVVSRLNLSPGNN